MYAQFLLNVMGTKGFSVYHTGVRLFWLAYLGFRHLFKVNAKIVPLSCTSFQIYH
jgi:hypothetical protein